MGSGASLPVETDISDKRRKSSSTPPYCVLEIALIFVSIPVIVASFVNLWGYFMSIVV